MTTMQLGAKEKEEKNVKAVSEKRPIARGHEIRTPQFLAGKDVEILYDGGPGEAVYGIAENHDGVKTRVFRWNGTDSRPYGFPLSCGRPCWVAMPKDKGFLKAQLTDMLDCR